MIVFETHEQVHDARARDGTNGLISIRQIGREDFGRARRRLWIAANQPERLVLRREKLDEFVADGAACSKDGDHQNLVVGIWLRFIRFAYWTSPCRRVPPKREEEASAFIRD